MNNNTLINNSKAQTLHSQSLISPTDAIHILKAGNDRFLAKKRIVRNYHEQISATSHGQYPFAVILSCIDSRVPTEIVFDQGIGDIFNACIAGNFINEDILGSMEYACKFAGVKLVVVMGHTSCGAVKGAVDSVQAGNLTQMLDKIMPAVDATSTNQGEERTSSNLTFVNRVSQKNVELAIEDIKKNSAILNELYMNGNIDIVPAMYDVKTGQVTFTNKQESS